VGVGYGAHTTEAFAALKPRFVAQTVAELHAWLLAHG
jgi:phosphoglycolate phosphatase